MFTYIVISKKEFKSLPWNVYFVEINLLNRLYGDYRLKDVTIVNR